MSFLLFFQTESPEASGCSTRRRRAAEQRYELAALHHSITSSAMGSAPMLDAPKSCQIPRFQKSK